MSEGKELVVAYLPDVSTQNITEDVISFRALIWDACNLRTNDIIQLGPQRIKHRVIGVRVCYEDQEKVVITARILA